MEESYGIPQDKAKKIETKYYEYSCWYVEFVSL